MARIDEKKYVESYFVLHKRQHERLSNERDLDLLSSIFVSAD